MPKYIRCKECDKPILFGSKIYSAAGWKGLVCSGECFVKRHATVDQLEKGYAEVYEHKVYDTDAVRKEMRYMELHGL